MYYTHINRNIIDSNTKKLKEGDNDIKPPIRIQEGKYGKPEYFWEVELPEKSRLVYFPNDPVLPCGARLVVISEEKPKGILTKE